MRDSLGRIDQWVPALHRGDAIGDSARLMRDAFRSWGHAADVWAPDVDDDLAGEGRPYAEFAPARASAADVVILHYALPSRMTDDLRSFPGRRVLLHHNVTPPEFFAAWDPEMERICALGREQIAGLKDHVDLALADSEFSRLELEAVGFERTGVLPIFLDFARYREAPNPVLLRQLDDERTNLLFVGRLAPNKRQEDLLRLASYWKRFFSPAVRLLVVGRFPRRTTGDGRPLKAHYFDALQAFAYEEGLTPEEVAFIGHADHADLLACYAKADVFVSTSEHEGFGVPLVEAMLMRVPVLARRAAAVPFTLGGGGVTFDGDDLAAVAEMARLLAAPGELRAGVLAAQERRLAAFAPAAVEAELRRFVDSL
ncbi:MAG TPA: glycosyltransferase family 4 protein [Vicinamibacteria bacterium]|nr:glycosyltransferase family 4 protein [Vicinamibacteria bacterium]